MAWSGGMRRRVVISINTAWNIANFRAGLIRSLMAEGWDVIAVAPPDPHVPRLVDMGCRFIPLDIGQQGDEPGRRRTIVRPISSAASS